MKIPEEYRELYSQAKKIDAAPKDPTAKSNVGSVLRSRMSAVRSVKSIIYCEQEINDLKEKIESAKSYLQECGIDKNYL